MLTFVFEKTDKGREEIATRQHQLSARLRPLLLLVDGKRSGAELLKEVGGELGEDSLSDLMLEGYIFLVADAIDPQAEPLQNALTDYGVLGIAESIRNPALQLEEIRRFYRDTVKQYIGLFGFSLRRKIDKAQTLEDLWALRAAYLERIYISAGAETARSLRDRLDAMFSG